MWTRTQEELSSRESCESSSQAQHSIGHSWTDQRANTRSPRMSDSASQRRGQKVLLEQDGPGLVFNHKKKFNISRKGGMSQQAERALERPRG